MKITKSFYIEESKVSVIQDLGNGNFSKGFEKLLIAHDIYKESFDQIQEYIEQGATNEQLASKVKQELRYIKTFLDRLEG